MSQASALLELTKPRLLPLVLLSGLPALVMAAGGWPSPTAVGAVLLGTWMAAGAANTLNCYVERESDGRMDRTRMRPLPSGRLSPRSALGFGLVLTASGTATLWLAASAQAALIALAAILFYVFVYTVWLKPRTPLAVLAGGISGAVAPLIADAAVDGQVGAAGWILFTIIFMWQPPHFYAIALYRQREYMLGGFPMLHDRVGTEATRRRIVLWVLGLTPVTMAPFALSMLGPIYATAATGLCLTFLWQAIRLWRRRVVREARRLFIVSLIFLMGIFLAMIVDLAVGAPFRSGL